MLLVTFVGLIPYHQQDKESTPTIKGPIFSVNPTNITPVCSFIFNGPDGKRAKVDFCGDKVVYSGDLPVADSARIFFDSVMADDKGRCEARDKSRVQHMRSLP